MSLSVGFGFAFKSALAAMIMPDWQKPHCGTSIATQAFCSAWVPSFERPSMVVILSVDFTEDAGITQLRVGVAVDVHRARAALRNAAAVLGASQTELLAQHPKQGRPVVRLVILHLAVHIQLCHDLLLVWKFVMRAMLPIPMLRSVSLTGAPAMTVVRCVRFRCMLGRCEGESKSLA